MIDKNFFNTLSEKKIVAAMFLYVFFLLVICSHMSPLYYSNEWADVNVYFNMGKAMMNGRTLYTEAFDHKGPFIFFVYGLGYLISNDSFLGMFLIQLIAWCVMTYFIYKLANLYIGKVWSYFVAAILPLFLIKIMKSGGSAEEFILVWECVSLYFFVKYFKDKNALEHKPSVMLVHGIMCSMVLFTKLNIVVFWAFPLAGIFLNLLIKKEYKNLILNVLAFIGGILVIALPICGYLMANNALDEAYSIYVELNRKYADLQGIGETIELLFLRMGYLFMDPLPLFLLAIVGTLYFPVRYIGNIIGKVVLVLSGISLYVVVSMSPVYQVYYPVVFLIYSLLGLLSLFLYVEGFVKTKQVSYTFLIIVSCVLAYAGYGQKELEDSKLANHIFKEKPGLLTQKMHDEISKEENPTLLNLGFGLGNSLFTTCNIVPNVRYFITPNLTYESYPDMRNEQTRYIENKETEFVVIPIPLKPEDMHSVSPKRRKTGNQAYFLDLPAFKENYSLVLTDTIVNSIDHNSYEIYGLFKRK